MTEAELAYAPRPRDPDAQVQAADMGTAPDAAAETLPLHGHAIDWVGMQGIQTPVLFDGGDGVIQRCNARVDAFVNLIRPDRRGIHMSRLYLLVGQYFDASPVDAGMLETLLHAFLRSQRDLADSARIEIRFEHLVRRKALRSNHHGWRAYPVAIVASLIGGVFHLELGTEVVYSSTCPASAALSRQLVQQQFAAHFDETEPLDRTDVLAWLGSEHGIVATPHAQRSVARLRVRFADQGPSCNVHALLERVEHALGTAVQAAVKREDEQAFALANGRNPMFCEDAVRRIRNALDGDERIAGYDIRVQHQESLHPHDAVASASKGMPARVHAADGAHESCA